uniref:Uncharacterized protein n=1 Tax=Brassica oleracea var. oleracea TaxID=109376 RepID=A0A0D3BD07_BRAOL
MQEKAEQWTESAKEIVHSARDKTANAAQSTKESAQHGQQQVSGFIQQTTTTRKHRYSDYEYRRYVLGITVFRGHTDENGRRKFLVGNQSFFRIFSENSDGIPRIKDSEDIPKNHFLGLVVGISSDISDGTVLRTIPREKRYRNIPTNFGRRNIPRKCIRRDIPRNYGRQNIPRNIFRRDIPRRYALGLFRGSCRRNIPRHTLPRNISKNNFFFLN